MTKFNPLRPKKASFFMFLHKFDTYYVECIVKMWYNKVGKGYSILQKKEAMAMKLRNKLILIMIAVVIMYSGSVCAQRYELDGIKIAKIAECINSHEYKTIRNEATCIKPAQEITRCENCVKVLKTANTSPARGHRYGVLTAEGVSTTQHILVEICSSCGDRRETLENHIFNSEGYCTRKGCTIKNITHKHTQDFKQLATCTKPGKCECGEIITPALRT